MRSYHVPTSEVEVTDAVVLCPRCGNHAVWFLPRGAFVSFCTEQIAFLLPQEFAPRDLERLKSQPEGGA